MKKGVIDCIKPFNEGYGFTEKWVGRGERCQKEKAEYQVVCECDAIRPFFACNLYRLCDSCAKKHKNRVVPGLAEALKGFPLWKERKGRGLSMLTLTQKNVTNHRHGVFLLKRAIKKWRRTVYGKRVQGGMYSIETSKGGQEGSYHVHAHLLIYGLWLDNRDKRHTVGELGISLTDLAHSWYIATDCHDYIVDIRPIQNREVGINYVLEYSFKPSKDLGEQFRVLQAVEQFKKRVYTSFGKFYNLKIVKKVATCYKCGSPYSVFFDFEIEYSIKPSKPPNRYNASIQ